MPHATLSECDDLDRLEVEYEQGKLVDLENAVENHLCAMRDDILRFKASQSSLLGRDIDDDLAVRLYLLEKRTVDLKLDAKAQKEEIEKERWYRRQCGSTQTDGEIALDWVRQHAAGWREHRIVAIVFVYDRIKERVLARLRGGRP